MTRLLTEYVDLEDIRIAYQQYGSGRVLILLHGNSESKHIFKQYQLMHFSMFHTIAVDSRGHGESQSNDDEYTIDQYSEDIINLCKVKGIKEAFVIGYSDGGNISLLLAKKAPDIFTRIVAISPNYLASGTADNTLRLFQRMMKILTFLNRMGFNLKKHIMRINLMLNDIGITEDELTSIRTKMKIIYAEHDLIKETHIKQMAELIPNASLNKIQGCNHMTILNNKEAIEVINNYLLEGS